MGGFSADPALCTPLFTTYCITSWNRLDALQVKVHPIDHGYAHENYSTAYVHFYSNGTELLDNGLIVNDIALLRLVDKINSTDTASGYPLINSICLPNEDFVEINNSLAMVSGYGMSEIGDFVNSDNGWPLQITYAKTTYLTNLSIIVLHTTLPTGGQTCGVNKLIIGIYNLLSIL